MKMLSLMATLFMVPAHDEKTSFSGVEVAECQGTWSVTVALAGLEKVLKLPADPLDLTERQLQSVKGEIADYILKCIVLEINGRPVPLEVGSLDPIEEIFIATGRRYIDRARLELKFRSDEEIRRLTLSLALFSTIFPEHRASVGVRWNGAERMFTRTGPTVIDVSDGSFWTTFREFVLSGMRHIFLGFDHVAFLLALLLGARKLGEMIRLVTSFTVAHSLTLFLAALRVVSLPSALTESLIAASIVYVALENCFVKEPRHRWILTFLFGLVHGLGFSSVLEEYLEGSVGIVLPVVSFNLGVELGQIAILLVAFPLLARLRRQAGEKRQRRILWVGSAPLLLLGLGWLIDRVFHLGWMAL